MKQIHPQSSVQGIDWNEYIVDDARNLPALIGEQEIFDVTVTSPPYWDIKDYASGKQLGYRQNLEEYLNDLVKVFSAVWQCTRPGGSLWIVIKSVKKNGRLHLLPSLLAQRLTSLSSHAWHLQDILIWQKTHTLPWSHRQKLTDNYENILCLSKTKNFSLNLDAIRSAEGISNWWVKYPERFHPYGKALSNVWEIAIPTQGSWGNGHFAHACPLPVELVQRAILLGSGPNGTVFDPFAGTGSTALAARNLGRKWLAVDVNRHYRNMFYRRLAHEPEAVTPSEINNGHLASANLSLRQLKFGLLLFKRLAPSLRLTATDVPIILVRAGKKQKAAKPHWVTSVTVQLVLSDECHKRRGKEIAAMVKEQCEKPPLSKFQLETVTTVLPRSQFQRDKTLGQLGQLYHYSSGEFWAPNTKACVADLSKIGSIGKLPAIISDILVRERPAF